MKKSLFFLTLCMMLNTVSGLVCASAATTPEWIDKLEQCSIIDSVVYVNDSLICKSNASVYHIYYHQPVSHQAHDGEQFQLRCVMIVRDDNDPATCSNEFYFGGYEIDGVWENASLCFNSKSKAEISHRYHSNLFIPEHRYFSYSSPEKCWEKLEWLNADEASQDFHALLEALKTVLKGKWVITGISKGGITTAMQHAFFPDDADIFVPNSAPFCRTVSDPRLHFYFENNGWTPELRERLDSMYREMIEDSAAINFFATLYRKSKPKATDYECRKAYLVNTLEKGFSLHSYTQQNIVGKLLDSNRRLKDSIMSVCDTLPHPASSYLNAKYALSDDPDASITWKEYIQQTKTESKAVSKPNKFYTLSEIRRNLASEYYSMTKEQWESSPFMAYYYQACLQLGQYTYDFHNIYKEPEEQAFADSLQAFFTREELDYTTFQNPWLKTVKYDNYALFSMVEQKTQTATKPIVFLYATDDPWTAAQMGDEYVNGDNVRKYILDYQIHGVSIDKDKTYKHDEIWEFIDKVMASDPSDITEVNQENDSGKALKLVKNGRIIIQKHGKQFTIAGHSYIQSIDTTP